MPSGKHQSDKSSAINFQAMESKKESLCYSQLTNSEFAEIWLHRVEFCLLLNSCLHEAKEVL